MIDQNVQPHYEDKCLLFVHIKYLQAHTANRVKQILFWNIPQIAYVGALFLCLKNLRAIL